MRKCLILVAALMPVLAFGEVPLVLGYQGRLLKPDGAPQTGTKSIIFSIYADPTVGDVLWNETQSLAITNGFVSTFVGAVTVIDPSLFTGRDLYLGVTVDGVELRPRQRIGSVGYAVRAHEVDSVPSGAVMFFNLAACPNGWTTLSVAQGRVIVGKPASGTLGGTVGTALNDLENRTHSHEISHTHSVNIESQEMHVTRSIGSSEHGYANTPYLVADVNGTELIGEAHDHQVTGNTESTSTSTSGTSSTSSTIPYVQLLVCQKL